MFRLSLSAMLVLIVGMANAQTYPSATFQGLTVKGPAQLPSVQVNPFATSTSPTTWLPACAVANCPPSLPTGLNASDVVQGVTQSGASTGEWLAVDGLYVNTGQPNGQKVTRYIGAVQGPLGGTTWALNTDVVRNGTPNGSPYGAIGSSSPGTPGAIPAGNGTVGYELDYTNWDQDTSTGPAPSFTVGEYIHNQSSYASWAGLYFDSVSQNNYAANTITTASWSPSAGGKATFTTATAHGVHVGDNVTISGMTPTGYNGTFFAVSGTAGTTIVVSLPNNPGAATAFGALAAYHNFAWHNGVQLNGAYIAEDNSFVENTHAAFGYQAWGAHLSDFYANSVGQSAISINGNHSVTDISVTDSAPTALAIGGTHSNAILDFTSSPSSVALKINSGAQICLNGGADCLLHTGGGLAYQPSGTAVASISDTGTITGTGVVNNGPSSVAYQYATPATGATVTLDGTKSELILQPAGALSLLTIVFPASASLPDGWELRITTTQTISTLSLSSGTAGILGNIASLGQYKSALFKWVGTGCTCFLRLDNPA